MKLSTKYPIKRIIQLKISAKRGKLNWKNIKDFAKKIHKKQLKIERGRNKGIFANISGTHFNCKRGRKFFR